MPEIVEFKPIPTLTTETNHVISWSDFEQLDYDEIMASLNVTPEYTDLDELLDVGDASDIIGNTASCSSNLYEKEDYNDGLDWCSDQSEISHERYQSIYQSQLEWENEKLAKENEAGLLEALQQSMDNIGCDVMSDLVSLSSSLNISPINSTTCRSSAATYVNFTPTLDDTVGSLLDVTTLVDNGITTNNEAVNPDCTSTSSTLLDGSDETSDDSVLKQLLLSPNNNYPREIDANNNCLIDHVAEQIVPKAFSDEFSGEVQRKRKLKKHCKKVVKKPFTELLKHLDSPNSPKSQGAIKPTTRVLNMSNYMRQYGSAPSSRVQSPLSDNGLKQKQRTNLRLVSTSPQRTETAGKMQTNVIIKPTHVLKPNPPAKAIVQNVKSNQPTEQMIVAPDVNSLLDMLEGERSNNWPFSPSQTDSGDKNFRPSADKRRSALLIDPLPKKRQRPNTEDLSKKVAESIDPSVLVNRQCTERPYAEHDYCHQQEGTEKSSNASDVLSAVIEASGLMDKPDASSYQVPVSKPSNPNKVLKWEEYLQRVRLGIRSAPNSPTTSPKIVRGSARPVKNFMLLNSCAAVKPPSKQTNLVTEPAAARKEIKTQRQPIKLEEFQEYIAKLQNKQMANVIPLNTAVPMSTNTSIKPVGNIIPVSSSSVSVAIPTCQAAIQQSRPIAPTQPFIKINSGGKIHTAAVTSSRATSHNNTPVVMIRIPAPGGIGASSIVGLPCISTQQSQVPTVVTAVPAQVISPNGTSLCRQSSNINTVKDPRSMTKTKARPAVLKSISRVNWSSKKTTPTTNTSATTTSSNTKSTINSAPTFKLITSNQGGVETKSLILSGVTGQLKEILTLLAQQQQQQQGTKHDQKETANSQQQKTLQQLLAAITNLKSKKSEVASSSMTGSVAPNSTSTIASNSSATKTTSACTKKVKKSIPSPLSLIHEIKQNMNKKTESQKAETASPHTRYVYTVPANSSTFRSRSKSLVTPGGGVLTTYGSETIIPASAYGRSQSCDSDFRTPKPNATDICPAKVTTNHIAYPLPTVPTSFLNTTSLSQEKQITVFVDRSKHGQSPSTDGEKLNNNTLKSDALEPTVITPLQTSNLPAACPSQLQEASCSQTETSAATETCTMDTDVVLGADNFASRNNDSEIEKSQSRNTEVGYVNAVVREVLMSVCDKVVDACDNVECGSNENERIPKDQLNSEPKHADVAPIDVASAKHVISQKPDEISRCRSMAAAEMMAERVVEGNQEEVLVYGAKPFESSVVDRNVKELGMEEGEISDNGATDAHYYNKLPAYLYSGKILNTDVNDLPSSSPVYEETINDLTRTGLKELSNDPLIGTEGNNSDAGDAIQYNKLPHYLSSGKLGPRQDNLVRGTTGDIIMHSGSSSGQQKRGLRFSTKIKCTPEGAVIDPSETFYSRLPSYYSYGRSHIVDTVTEPPDEPDDTVTQESLVKQDEERRSRKEKHKRKKRKHKKNHKKTDKRLDGDRILYSKLPGYLLSGRKSLAPERGGSEHSCSSSQSLSSDSERETSSLRQRSFRRSYSANHERSASLSSSRSRSRSPRRSWRQERYYKNESRSSSRRCGRGYSSSDSDYDDHHRSKRRRRRSSSGSDWDFKLKKKREQKEKELKNQAIQQRRVMYVGRISDSTTKLDLSSRFRKFGEVDDVALHFRKGKDSYAFVTFRYTCDTFAAIEHGNDGDVQPKYVLCFGGRRQFCQVDYADLDEQGDNSRKNDDEVDFDTLLKQAMHR